MVLRKSLLALLLGGFLAPLVAQEVPAVYFFVRRTDRGTSYKQGDISQTFSAYKPDGTKQRCVLPPGDPDNWIIQVEGINPEEAEQYMAPSYNPDGSVNLKRVWYVRLNKMPTADRDFLIANRFLGFGADLALYGSLVAADRVVNWAEFQTWLVHK